MLWIFPPLSWKYLSRIHWILLFILVIASSHTTLGWFLILCEISSVSSGEISPFDAKNSHMNEWMPIFWTRYIIILNVHNKRELKLINNVYIIPCYCIQFKDVEKSLKDCKASLDVIHRFKKYKFDIFIYYRSWNHSTTLMRKNIPYSW